MTHRTTPRVPYIPAGCDQQGRLKTAAHAACPDWARCSMPICACHPLAAEPATDIGARQAEQIDSMRRHRRVAGWARWVFGAALLVLALVSAGALYGAWLKYGAHSESSTTPTTTPTTTRITT